MTGPGRLLDERHGVDRGRARRHGDGHTRLGTRQPASLQATGSRRRGCWASAAGHEQEAAAMTSGGSRGRRVRGGGFRRTKEGTAAPYDGEGSPRKDAEGEAEVKGEGRPGGNVTEAG